MKKIFLLFIAVSLMLFSCKKKTHKETDSNLLSLDSSKSNFTEKKNSSAFESIDYSQFEQNMYDENGDLIFFVYLYDHLDEQISTVVENTQSEFKFDRGTKAILISLGENESKITIAPACDWKDKYDTCFHVVKNINLFSKIPEDKIKVEEYSPKYMSTGNLDREDNSYILDYDIAISNGIEIAENPKYMSEFFDYWNDIRKKNEDMPFHVDSVLSQSFNAITHIISSYKNYTYFIKDATLEDEESSFLFDVFPGMKLQNFERSDNLGSISDSVYYPDYSGTIGFDDGNDFTKTVNISKINGNCLATNSFEVDIDDDYKYVLAYKQYAPIDEYDFDKSKLEKIYDDYMFWEIKGLKNGLRNRNVVLMKVPKKQFNKENAETNNWNDFSHEFASKVETWNLLEEDYAEGGFIEGTLSVYYLRSASHPIPLILKTIFNGGNGGGVISYEWYALDPENAGIRKICDYSYVSCEAVNGESNYSLYGNTLTYSVFEQEAGCPVSQNDTFVYEQSSDDPLRFDLADHYEGQMK